MITSPSSGRPISATLKPLKVGRKDDPSGICLVRSLVRTKRVFTSSGAGVLVSITFKRALITGRYRFLSSKVPALLAAKGNTPEIQILEMIPMSILVIFRLN